MSLDHRALLTLSNTMQMVDGDFDNGRSASTALRQQQQRGRANHFASPQKKASNPQPHRLPSPSRSPVLQPTSNITEESDGDDGDSLPPTQQYSLSAIDDTSNLVEDDESEVATTTTTTTTITEEEEDPVTFVIVGNNETTPPNQPTRPQNLSPEHPSRPSGAPGRGRGRKSAPARRTPASSTADKTTISATSTTAPPSATITEEEEDDVADNNNISEEEEDEGVHVPHLVVQEVRDNRKFTGQKAPRSRVGLPAAQETEVIVAKKPKAHRRRRPGTLALREIRQQQLSVNACIPRLPFSRLVREITDEIHPNHPLRWTKNALLALQEGTEDFAVRLLEQSNDLTHHRRQITLAEKDLHRAFDSMIRHNNVKLDTHSFFHEINMRREERTRLKETTAIPPRRQYRRPATTMVQRK